MTAATAQKIPDYAAIRHNMIEGQIRPNKVRDERVLSVLEDLPRELFVPMRLAGVAYIDENLPVGQGRFLLSPMVLARMLEEAKINAEDHVLDIAPATGYSTAVLARLAKDVVAVESDADLQKQAAENLSRLEIKNANVRTAPLQKGFGDAAPYDVIFINGAVDRVPEDLLCQLKDGGRLIAVVRRYAAAHYAHTGEVRLYLRSGEVIKCHSLFDANVALLPGFASEESFSF